MEPIKGEKYNKLTFVDYTIKNGRKMCLCQCECGNTTIVQKQKLLSGRSKSCGCAKTNAMEKYRNYIGREVNNWRVLDVYMKSGVCYARCECRCGEKRDVNIYNLLNGQSKDCGCGRKEFLSDAMSKDVIGQRFGKLVVTECVGSNKFKRRLYKCICDCGNETITTASLLLDGRTQSCGCLLSQCNAHIGKLLTKEGVKHISEYAVKIDGLCLRFDFYLPEYNAAIEYDGEQHFMPVNYGQNDTTKILHSFEKRQKYDRIKDAYCSNNHIDLLRIPYWDKNNITQIINNYLQRLNEKGAVKTAYATV